MNVILVLHSIIRWAVLLSGIWVVINAVSGITSKRVYSSLDDRSNLFFMIFCDIQLLIGLILIFTNGWFVKIKSGMGELMKDPYNRFFVVEHGMMMIVALILVHIGRSKVKKASPESKHKKMLLFFGVAILLIVISIPWPNKAVVGRPMISWFN